MEVFRLISERLNEAFARAVLVEPGVGAEILHATEAGLPGLLNERFGSENLRFHRVVLWGWEPSADALMRAAGHRSPGNTVH